MAPHWATRSDRDTRFRQPGAVCCRERVYSHAVPLEGQCPGGELFLNCGSTAKSDDSKGLSNGARRSRGGKLAPPRTGEAGVRTGRSVCWPATTASNNSGNKVSRDVTVSLRLASSTSRDKPKSYWLVSFPSALMPFSWPRFSTAACPRGRSACCGPSFRSLTCPAFCRKRV